ncbi:hypothetical protein K438DRAFT_1768080 [Mycena galopus ATCC 62051]|nr:hypothetical protein K438DRAFT_1768080 [Mycena galopus ATCC 62051]
MPSLEVLPALVAILRLRVHAWRSARVKHHICRDHKTVTPRIFDWKTHAFYPGDGPLLSCGRNLMPSSPLASAEDRSPMQIERVLQTELHGNYRIDIAVAVAIAPTSAWSCHNPCLEPKGRHAQNWSYTAFVRRDSLLVYPKYRSSTQTSAVRPRPVLHISCIAHSGHSYDAPGQLDPRAHVRVRRLPARGDSALESSQIKSAPGAKHLDRLDFGSPVLPPSMILPPAIGRTSSTLNPILQCRSPQTTFCVITTTLPGTSTCACVCNIPSRTRCHLVSRLSPRKLNPRQQRETSTGRIHSFHAPELPMVIHSAIGLTSSILFLNVGVTLVPADLSVQWCIKLVIMVGRDGHRDEGRDAPLKDTGGGGGGGVEDA